MSVGIFSLMDPFIYSSFSQVVLQKDFNCRKAVLGDHFLKITVYLIVDL